MFCCEIRPCCILLHHPVKHYVTLVFSKIWFIIFNVLPIVDSTKMQNQQKALKNLLNNYISRNPFAKKKERRKINWSKKLSNHASKSTKALTSNSCFDLAAVITFIIQCFTDIRHIRKTCLNLIKMATVFLYLSLKALVHS